MLFRKVLLAAVLVCAAMFASVPAQEPARVTPSLFSEMKWRNIGPHRASRRTRSRYNRGRANPSSRGSRRIGAGRVAAGLRRQWRLGSRCACTARNHRASLGR